MEACWELLFSSRRPDRSPYVCFSLFRWREGTQTYSWSPCRTHTQASQVGAETQPTNSPLGRSCVCRVPPSPPFPLALCWYSDYVCWACSALKVWARQVAKEWLSHWMFDYVQTVTVTIICVTVLPVNVFMSWHFRDQGSWLGIRTVCILIVMLLAALYLGRWFNKQKNPLIAFRYFCRVMPLYLKGFSLMLTHSKLLVLLSWPKTAGCWSGDDDMFRNYFWALLWHKKKDPTLEKLQVLLEYIHVFVVARHSIARSILIFYFWSYPPPSRSLYLSLCFLDLDVTWAGWRTLLKSIGLLTLVLVCFSLTLSWLHYKLRVRLHSQHSLSFCSLRLNRHTHARTLPEVVWAVAGELRAHKLPCVS